MQRIRKCAGQLIRSSLHPFFKDRDLAEALSQCEDFSQRGLCSSVGYWNDKIDTPRTIADANLNLITRLSRYRRTSYLSIKAPPLHYSSGLLSEIASCADENGIRLHFDAHGPDTCSPTLKLIDSLLPTMSRIGCTLPGRWRRSLADADWAIERNLYVRVVKGQWEDREGPSIDQKIGFLSVVDRLAGRANHVSVATHDPVLAETALKRLSLAGTPCELELMLAMPNNKLRLVAESMNIPVRYYVPYGHGWLQYIIDQMLANPSRTASIALKAASEFRFPN